MTTEHEKQNEEVWPAVPHAYEFVRPLYEMTERRYVAVEARILQLGAFSVTIMLASVTIHGATNDHLTMSTPFLLAAIILAVQVVIGLVFTAYGHIATFNLGFIVENALHYSEWEFKKNVLYWAKGDIATNIRLVNVKGWIVWSMTSLFLAEGACLLWWLLV